MNEKAEAPIRDISDIALWAAVYRAQETQREDAVFRDPFARRLAGARGVEIADNLPEADRNAWVWAMRTYLVDRVIARQVVREGVDMVINLAAGLDARPYRMGLPSTLQWIEIDLPSRLDYKEQILNGEEPVCAVERLRLDLADLDGRRRIFEQLSGRANKALIVTEGLLIYMKPDEVRSLARELSASANFQRWVLDLQSPGLLRTVQKNWGQKLSETGAPPRFCPREGPEFFTYCGWQPVDVLSVFKTAIDLKRGPLWTRLLGLLPESNGRQGLRPWSGVCLFRKAMTARGNG